MMKKAISTAKCHHLVSPYLFVLATFFAVMMIGSGIASAYMLIPSVKSIDMEWIIAILLLIIPHVTWIVFFYVHAYELFGSVSIKTDCLILRAPLHKTICIRWKEVKELGIDYGMLSVSKQFWIYISNTTIQKQYVHKITNLPFSSSCIRVQYSKHVFNSFIHYLPSDLRKRLLRCTSTLRLHGIKTD